MLWKPTPGVGNELSEDERLLASILASIDSPYTPSETALLNARRAVSQVLELRDAREEV